jgi:hypothetical protein
MTTNNSINISAAGIVKYDGAGTFSADTVVAGSLIYGGASNALNSLALTPGQLPIGNTSGSAPVAATLTAGTGVSIVNAPGSITINASGGGLSWTNVTGTAQAAAVNNGYLANNASLVTITLPATAAQFSVVAIAGNGAGGWQIAQNAGQNIQFGKLSTTAGTGGSLASTNQFDCVYLLCTTANTTFTVLNSVGNITVN